MNCRQFLRATLTAVLAVLLSSLAMPAAAADRLAVNTFPNAKALALWAGIERGIFAANGIDLALTLTESSDAQRSGLAAGRTDIAVSALDNAIALIVAGHDVAIVTGGDGGMNDLMVQGDVGDWADIRGRWLAVDAPDTAYALQVRKILGSHGLVAGRDYEVKPVGNGGLRYKAMLADKRYAIAVLNLPFTIEGRAKGLKSMGNLIDLLGPYQAGGAFVLRAWAANHGDLIERYIKSYVIALRWVRDPANRAAATALLRDKLKIDDTIAAETFKLLIDPRLGYAVDAKLDPQGFANMLALRAEVQGGRDDKRAAIERAVDLTYYDRALASLR